MTDTADVHVPIDRRTEIVGAARSCFQRWGLAKTTMDDIAKEVEVRVVVDLDEDLVPQLEADGRAGRWCLDLFRRGRHHGEGGRLPAEQVPRAPQPLLGGLQAH